MEALEAVGETLAATLHPVAMTMTGAGYRDQPCSSR
jgi:hypothetical protein